MRLKFFQKKPKKKTFLVLDIGTEAVKAAVSEISEEFSGGKSGEISKGKSVFVLGAGLKYFDRYSSFKGEDFESEVLKKAIVESAESAFREFLKNTDKNEITGLREKIKKIPVLAALPANILRARVGSFVFKRENPKSKISEKEEKKIENAISEDIKKEMALEFRDSFGIMPEDLEWVRFDIIGRRIDGYSVSKIKGYEGKVLEFRALAMFLPKLYSLNFRKIFNDLGFKELKFIHLAETLLDVLESKNQGDVFLFDLGGKIIQVFYFKKEELAGVFELSGGGNSFSKKVSDAFGSSEDLARIFKERYASGSLSPDVEKRVGETFFSEKNSFSKNLKNELLKKLGENFFYSKYYLFGGASCLPEIKKSFIEVFSPLGGASRPASSQNQEKGDFFSLLSGDDFSDLTKKMSNPQYIPILLLSKYGKKVL